MNDDYTHGYGDSLIEKLRTPPHSVEAEQAVLGGAMLSPPAWNAIADRLSEEDFYRRDHQLIFRAITELADRNLPFDAVTLGEWFEGRDMAELVAGGAYLIELASTTPSAANIRAYADIVRDKAKLRALITAGTDIVNAGFSPEGRNAEEVIAEAGSTLLQLGADKTAEGAKSMREVATEWFDNLQARYYNPEVIHGVRTPWSTLNKRVMALETGHLVIVAGRPSMGKSVVGVNLSTDCAMGESPEGVHYIDLESTARAIFNRAVASVAGVPLNFLRNPRKYEEELAERRKLIEEIGGRAEDEDTDVYWSKITAAVAAIKASPLKIDDTPGLSIQRIIARARAAHMQQPYKMLVIDHLHLIPLPGKTRETVEIGHITAALKQLAKELKITVVLLSQLNRSLESRADKRPTMADLRESGNIEQDADVILLLYRDDYYAEREKRASRAPGLLEIFVAKQREGEIGSAYAKTNLPFALLEDVSEEEVKRILASGTSDEDEFGDKKPPKSNWRTSKPSGKQTTPRPTAVPA